MRSKYKKQIILSLAAVFSVFGVSVLFGSSASSLSGSSFIANRIIDDTVFYNGSSMTASQVQTFLNAKMPSCDTNGEKPITSGSSMTRAEWAEANGKPLPPYICLKDFKQDHGTKSDSGLCGHISAKSGRSAAQIIDDVARACNISQKALIVTLQKEQSLVTDDWPWPVQYDKAMGYHCPDDPNRPGWCHPDYAGFFNQVYNAAKQFNRYRLFPENYNHAINRTSFVSYQANSPGCGGTNLTMQTAGTAGLYNYTPYQPNKAALDNLYGTGDSCSAYGNRNFWRMYNDWFGPTLASAWNYEFVKSSGASLWFQPGMKRIGHYITIRNTGTETWYADGAVPDGKFATRLALRSYQNSPFADTDDPRWLGTRNQIKMTPDVVAPGEEATFVFNLVGPKTIYESPYVHSFVPVVNGVTAMRDINMQKRFTNVPPPYSHVSSTNIPSVIYANQRLTSSIKIRNTGAVNWYADGSVPQGQQATRLALKGYQNSPFADTDDPRWLGTRNQIKMTPDVVAPGEEATFVFNIKGPFTQKQSTLYFIPVLNGISFMKDIAMFYTIKMPGIKTGYRFISATNPPRTIAPGSIANVSITIQNKGTVVWNDEASGIGRLRLIMARPSYRNSIFYDPSAGSKWITSGQIIYDGSEAGLDGTATFNFTWKAPTTAGTYTEYFKPVLDGYASLEDRGMAFTVTVAP